MQPITVSLIITVVGMGLVFAAIILLWGLMELIVRFTAKAESMEEAKKSSAEVVETKAVASDMGRKQKAAAVAVAIAAALHQKGYPVSTSSAEMTAWQSTALATHASQRASVMQRR